MYGGHEFADNGADRGLEALWTATQVAGATPEATEAPPGPPAQPPQAPGWPEGLPVDPEGGDREAGGDAQDPQLPKASDLDDRRLQGARSLHKAMENKDQVHLRLTGWKPVASKPRQAELHFVICERDPKQRPKHWKIHKMVEFLLGAPDGAQPDPDRTREAPGPGPAIGTWPEGHGRECGGAVRFSRGENPEATPRFLPAGKISAAAISGQSHK